MEGCPTDTDGDGIFDGIDQCQGTPAGVEVDASGCPTVPKLDRKLVLHDITFESASSEITPDSYPQLDEVILSLKAWLEIELEIRGYADSKGTKKRNLELTQERAEAVRDYFVSHGIEARRLVALGYGEEEPIASNDTEEGRAENRRVELHRTD
jgi:OOP family OmpA-OmpF porin